MATSSQVLSTSQSQVIANFAVITEGHTAQIHNFVLHPRTGPSQSLTLHITVDSTIEIELNLIYFDEAFEEFDLFGGRKNTGPGEGEVGGGRL